MDKLVNEIIASCKFNNRINAKVWTGICGIIVIMIFIIFFLRCSVSITHVAKEASSTAQEVVALSLITITCVIALYALYYIIKYFALIMVPLMRFGFTPIIKNRTNSIESIMTDIIEDKSRMHKAIVNYLRRNHTPRHFAALYIWLSTNHLIDVQEQNEYLKVLKIDFPDLNKKDQNKDSVRVPAPSSFSEAKSKLEEKDSKMYQDNRYPKIFKYLFESFLIDDWDS